MNFILKSFITLIYLFVCVRCALCSRVHISYSIWRPEGNLFPPPAHVGSGTNLSSLGLVASIPAL